MTSGKHVADANEPDHSEADAVALAEEAEAEAAAAEALAKAARARARAARLRRAALGSPVAPATQSRLGGYLDRLPMTAIGITALVVLIVAFAGLTVLMTKQHQDNTARQERTAAFVAGAKQCVIYMTSMDFNNAKADVQRVIDSSTGDFKTDYQQRAPDLATVVAQSKVVSEGTVNAAALESIEANTAQVLVSATSRITNSPPGKQEPPRAWRMRVTVVEDGGQYKMSKVEFVP